MLTRFNDPWGSVPLCEIDTETTGTVFGKDKAVSVALVRFEGGKEVARFSSLVNPGFPIPETATAIHKITDAMVADAPSIGELFASESVVRMLDGAQLGAFNWKFDREFIPRFGDDRDRWPWLDALPIIRLIDSRVSGKKRHSLEVSCARHGVSLTEAHSSEADARAAGELLFKVARKVKALDAATLGEALSWQLVQESQQWFEFQRWLSRQPPLPTKGAA